MQHSDYFEEFIRDHINLNDSRLKQLENSISAVTNYLKGNLSGYKGYSPQGSYAHKTIIKPVQDNDEFDADILVLIEDRNFSPNIFNTDYCREIHQVLKNNHNYKGKITLNTRCVTINYAGDFHMDVVPCINHNGKFYICNRKEVKYEETDGEGYRDWLIDKNRIIGGNFFRKTTRLLKFLRDHKDNFSVKSILLTTLLGKQVDERDEFTSSPETLFKLSERVNKFLQNNPRMPKILNPVLSGEDFNRNWDQTKYANFREKFNIYYEKSGTRIMRATTIKALINGASCLAMILGK